MVCGTWWRCGVRRYIAGLPPIWPQTQAHSLLVRECLQAGVLSTVTTYPQASVQQGKLVYSTHCLFCLSLSLSPPCHPVPLYRWVWLEAGALPEAESAVGVGGFGYPVSEKWGGKGAEGRGRGRRGEGGGREGDKGEGRRGEGEAKSK